MKEVLYGLMPDRHWQWGSQQGLNPKFVTVSRDACKLGIQVGALLVYTMLKA
jgi:hypothetical protein